jgi:hypothetical protein
MLSPPHLSLGKRRLHNEECPDHCSITQEVGLKTTLLVAGVGLAFLLPAARLTAAEGLLSGPQVGKFVNAFDCLNVLNAEDRSKNGTHACLV